MIVMVNELLANKAIKFLISGATAALVEYVVFLALHAIQGPEWIIFSQSISFMCGFVVSFLLNKNWVFKSVGGTSRELQKYSILAGVNLILSNLALWLFVDTLAVVFWAAKFIVMAMVATWNYFIFQRIIFRSK